MTELWPSMMRESMVVHVCVFRSSACVITATSSCAAARMRPSGRT
jgi:hypothetical protein